MARTPHRFQPTTSLEDNLAYLNQNFDVIDDQDLTKIINNGTTPTILFGYQAGGFNGLDYGLKVAKPGVDVIHATDDQLVFSSAFNVFKIVKTMTLTLTKAAASADTGLVSAPHDLGYVPTFAAFASYDGTLYQPMPISTPEISGAGVGLTVLSAFAQADSTNVYAELLAPNTGSVHSFYGGVMNIDVKFYLMRETAN